jgi:hypothetical protein
MMTFDGREYSHDAQGNMRGKTLPMRVKMADGKVADSTGSFLVGELERLDLRLHEPLAAVTWGRDIDLREDVTIANEVSSFTLSTYGSAAGANIGTSGVGIGNGKSWVGKDTTQITGISVDIAKIPHALRPWSMELKYTILELESSALVGRPIDQQKFFGMQLKHQMDIDEMVYYGDTEFAEYGVVNYNNSSANLGQVSNVATVAVGATNATQWVNKTPPEILNDVNEILNNTWATSGWAFPPNRLLLPPAQYSYVSTQIVSAAGNVSILRYLLENNLLTSSGVAKLKIFPLKWLIGAGIGGTVGTLGTVDRMVAYTKDPERLRYPMTLLQRTPIQYDGIYHKSTYFCRLGVLEVVYPETVAYRDGI